MRCCSWARCQVQYRSKSPLLIRARSLRMASAPSRPQRSPVMSMRSLTRWRQAPSMTPVAMGHNTTSYVNSDGLPTQIIRPGDATTLMSYLADGSVETITDPEGGQTHLQYD